jgi:hypothetical protein
MGVSNITLGTWPRLGMLGRFKMIVLIPLAEDHLCVNGFFASEIARLTMVNLNELGALTFTIKVDVWVAQEDFGPGSRIMVEDAS